MNLLLCFLGIQSSSPNRPSQQGDDLPLCDKSFSWRTYHSSGQKEDDVDTFSRAPRTWQQGRNHVQTRTRWHIEVWNRRTFQGRKWWKWVLFFRRNLSLYKNVCKISFECLPFLPFVLNCFELMFATISCLNNKLFTPNSNFNSVSIFITLVYN